MVMSPVLHMPMLPLCAGMVLKVLAVMRFVVVSVAASVSMSAVPYLCARALSSAGSWMEMPCKDIHSHSLYIHVGIAALAGLVVNAVLSTGWFLPDNFCSLSIASNITSLTSVLRWLSACVSMLSLSMFTRSAHLCIPIPAPVPHTTLSGVFLFIFALLSIASFRWDWARSICSILALVNLSLYIASARMTLLDAYSAWSAVSVGLLRVYALVRTD